MRTCKKAPSGAFLSLAVTTNICSRDRVPIAHCECCCLPELLVAGHALLHLHLECWRAEGEPVLIQAIEQEALMFRREILEPFYSLVIWSIADWYGNVNILTVPIELCREENDFALSGAEPVW